MCTENPEVRRSSSAIVFEAISAPESLEAITAHALAGATGGPPALCQVLRRMGPGGVDAAVAAFLRTSASELREALKKFIGDNLDRHNSTQQNWQFLGAALNYYCPDQRVILDQVAAAQH